jgi:hypothetical protein
MTDLELRILKAVPGSGDDAVQLRGIKSQVSPGGLTCTFLSAVGSLGAEGFVVTEWRGALQADLIRRTPKGDKAVGE